MPVGCCQNASPPVSKALGIARRRDDGHLVFHRYADADGQDGSVPLMAELRRAAASVRKIATETESLPDDTPSDVLLRERLELAAEVLDATVQTPSTTDQGQMSRSSRMATCPVGDNPLATSCFPLASISGPSSDSSSTRKPRCS